MADQAPVQQPEIKPGMYVWTGRFRNRPAVVSKVWNENGKVKFEVIPIPQGRKRPKERNLLPFKPMNAEDTAKYKAVYEDDQRKRKKKSAKVAERYSSSVERFGQTKSLHEQIAKALGWTDRDVKSMSLHSLRDLVRPVDRALADEITHVIARGGHI